MVTTQTNLERLSDMLMMQFGTTLEQSTIKQIQQAVECIMAEDDFIHNEDIYALDSENAYYGLIAF
jgi:hypothetical protein